MVSPQPLVSLIIPMRNEERFIARCLDSIVGNDYPHDHMEVLVADGLSTDRSRELVEEYARRYSFIRLLDNPKRLQAAGFNLALAEATGEVVLRIDAHTTYARDYIQQCVDALGSSGAANVGGAQQAVGDSYVTNTIAIATTSRFGMGDARHRYGSQAAWVDTVYLGAWRRSTLEQLGGLDEAWAVNEDYEMNYRLRRSGGGIWLSPDIQCWYTVRGSLPGLARQYFRYGLWKVKTLQAHPASLRWRQLVPPAFVAALAGALAALPVWWPAIVAVASLYLTANLGASTGTALRRGLRYLPLLSPTYAVVHLAWGLGFWAGMLRFGVPIASLFSLRQAFRRPAGGKP